MVSFHVAGEYIVGMVDDCEQFSNRLEEFLNKRELANRQVAESIGCTGATIGRWKRGEVPYSVALLAGLRREYGVDLNMLICGEDK